MALSRQSSCRGANPGGKELGATNVSQSQQRSGQGSSHRATAPGVAGGPSLDTMEACASPSLRVVDTSSTSLIALSSSSPAPVVSNAATTLGPSDSTNAPKLPRLDAAMLPPPAPKPPKTSFSEPAGTGATSAAGSGAVESGPCGSTRAPHWRHTHTCPAAAACCDGRVRNARGQYAPSVDPLPPWPAASTGGGAVWARSARCRRPPLPLPRPRPRVAAAPALRGRRYGEPMNACCPDAMRLSVPLRSTLPARRKW